MYININISYLLFSSNQERYENQRKIIENQVLQTKQMKFLHVEKT